MFASFTLAALALALTTAAPDTTELNADSLLRVLKQGGYTILLRHARTDKSYMDDPRTAPLDDRTKQRNLSDAGVADARAIGLVMRTAGIPIGEIVSSPLFRARETAQIAFGEPALSAELMSLTATPDQRALVFKSAARGTNRVIVTHHFIIERYVPGIELGEIAESEAAVVRTTPNGEMTMVGRFTLADWERLSGGKTAVASATERQAEQNLFKALHGGGGQLRAAPGASASLQPFDWTATPATRLAGLYLHAFNSGDAEQMRAFIDNSLVADPNRSTQQRVETYRTMFGEHGAISIVGTESALHNEARIRVRSKRGEFSVIVTVSPSDHARAESVRLVGAQ
ncbi:MAG TPA: histidine phosphatase family protein [Gemmatimonadaceae bacterium]|jgi:phosphohistidine phosphatase SixA